SPRVDLAERERLVDLEVAVVRLDEPALHAHEVILEFRAGEERSMAQYGGLASVVQAPTLSPPLTRQRANRELANAEAASGPCCSKDESGSEFGAQVGLLLIVPSG